MDKKESFILNLQNYFDKCRNSIRNINDRRLNVENKSIKLIRLIFSLEEEVISDHKSRMTISELKEESKSLKNLISNQINDDHLNIPSTDIFSKSEINDILKEKEDLIEKLMFEINQLKRNNDSINNNKKINFLFNKKVNKDDNNDLKITIHRLQSDLDQKNEELNDIQKELFEKRDQLRKYREISAEYDDLIEENKVLKSQQSQINNYSDQLNLENMKLIKENKYLKEQLSNKGDGFESIALKYSTISEELDNLKKKYNDEKFKFEKQQTFLNESTINNDESNLKTEILME